MTSLETTRMRPLFNPNRLSEQEIALVRELGAIRELLRDMSANMRPLLSEQQSEENWDNANAANQLRNAAKLRLGNLIEKLEDKRPI